MPGRTQLVVRGAKRAAPLIMEAYRRWEQLPEKDKERYRQRVRDSSERVRELMRKRRGGR
jgi:hypothetical protein